MSIINLSHFPDSTPEKEKPLAILLLTRAIREAHTRNMKSGNASAELLYLPCGCSRSGAGSQQTGTTNHFDIHPDKGVVTHRGCGRIIATLQ